MTKVLTIDIENVCVEMAATFKDAGEQSTNVSSVGTQVPDTGVFFHSNCGDKI